MFNDGVAVVIFASLLEIIQNRGISLSASNIILLFAREAIGGVIYGLMLGYLSFRLIRPINNYQVEVIITIALVMGGYALANWLHISGPLAMVVAGILIGNKGRNEAMSPLSRDYLSKFWELIDEVLNAILFLLIGLEMLLIPLNGELVVVSGVSILILLFARWVSVIIPVSLLKLRLQFEKGAIKTLTWGGLRGGLSLALALSISDSMGRNVFLPTTYIIVVFSILVQGLTIGKVAKRIHKF